MNNALKLLEGFRAQFGTHAAVYRAPGRVNLIGEHTDYNDGFVLPAAIEFSCWVAIAPREDRKLVLYSENFSELHEADLDALPPHGSGLWADYAVGVAAMLERAGNRLRGANIYISGDIPLGAGLSSSAAIEVSVGYALLDTARLRIDRTSLALACRLAENEFVGAHVGIMDQFVSCHGRSGHALLIDCRSLEFRLFPLPRDLTLVICNSMVKHAIAAGEYNTRRAECEEGVARLKKALPEIRALRDVSLQQLQEHRGLLADTVYRRCRHIVTENTRVLEYVDALQRGETQKLATLMAESHRSLRDDFQVSCAELDTLVDIAARQPGVHGSRMTGGGFGGCTINLVESDHTAEFQRAVAQEYLSATGHRPDIYITVASQGVEPVPLAETRQETRAVQGSQEKS